MTAVGGMTAKGMTAEGGSVNYIIYRFNTIQFTGYKLYNLSVVVARFYLVGLCIIRRHFLSFSPLRTC